MTQTNFSPERLRLIETVERDHFWFVSRRNLVKLILRRYSRGPVRTLVDIGCGTGYNLQEWTRYSQQVIGVDRLILNSSSRSRWDAALLSKSVLPICVEGDVGALPLASACSDMVVALDVLEHVEDKQALAEANRILKPGGKLILTVPALPWLWSYRDVAAGHLRRYTRRSLQRSVEGAGFEILFTTYFQCFIFPVFALSRWLGRRGPRMRDLEDRPQPLINPLMKGVNAIESLLVRARLSLPWGSSLVLIAEKNR